GGPGLVVLAQAQAGLGLAGGAPGRGDQPRRVGLRRLPVGTRLVVVALEAGARGEPEEVVHALGGGRPHRHVGVGPAARDVVAALLGDIALAPADPAAVGAVGARGEVGLDPDDRPHAVGAGLAPEVEGTVEVAVV